MYTDFQVRRRKLYQLVTGASIIMAILLFACSACGASGSNGGSTGSTPPIATPTSSAGTGNTGNSNGTSQGCPSNATVSNPPKPTRVVELSGSATAVTAHPGDVIELHLPFGKKWSGPTVSSDSVTLLQPAGYAVNASKACVWSFSARSVGTTHLTFTMRPICKSGTMCPMYIAQVPVTINVK